MRQVLMFHPQMLRARWALRRAIAVSLALLIPFGVQAAEITVFAATSMKTALDQIAADWSRGTENSVALAYDASPKLAKQIQQGAPADLFISAAPEWMDILQADGLIAAETRRDLVSNQIVLIAYDPATPPVIIGPDLDLPALLAGGRLSMAMVDSVPAGQYGKEALEHFGLWTKIEANVVQANNARAALALVARGEAPLGVVYASDAIPDADGIRPVTVIATFPADSHRAIRYPAARMAASTVPEAQAFLDYLSSDAALAVFAANGFTLLPGDD
jgi:molybdate transport system substrate-binding protein